MIAPLLGSPDAMLQRVYAALARHGLPLDLPCDHVCYRVATPARYDEIKQAMQPYGTLASEAVIAGRPIASFALHTPLVYGAQRIPCLELPSPKPGRDYAEGWEHAEFATGAPLEHFIARYPHVPFNLRAMGKAHNPEISLEVDAHTAIKFHPEPLLTVIEKEIRLGLTP